MEKKLLQKNEKKINPILYLAADKEKIIIADNLANTYAIDIFSGDLIWKKNNNSPFNSQIKIYNNKFFSIDYNNVIKCFSSETGKELWSFVTENSFIKSQQKLSLIIEDEKVIFINSLGDISALDIKTGNLVWQTPTQSTSVYEDAFSLENSDLVFEDNSIFFSNNKNQFYALDFKTGIIKWKQNVNSNLRPTVIDKLIFTISKEGYLIIIDSNNGSIIRSTSLFENNKKLTNSKLEPVGFVVTKDKIYLSLDNGYILKINIENGKTEDLIKIGKNKISRPYIVKQKMYIVRNNAILKLN